MIWAVLPVAMIVIGALMYGYSANPKVCEIGRLMVMAGLFAFAFTNANKMTGIW